ncbi:MAG: hypothetical protein GWO41_11595 [candidate division Zixibacteria bacterium]|nr:hypothetical protein [candidate division Zixibacteria bacterium]NIS16974.1 hypothetical protein [candidate division Zixibacteria bacterium]NIS45168.1 hypothetical protein [candidate division Zixibacteria bacterium]NIT53352.1 hypothetical protein [candidate division Zixibacteria bacterium]NIU13328.1 hypothetical protein [candidate division Zixibacteria bacterium]
MMRNLILLVISIFMVGLFIFCGGNDEDKEVQESQKAEAADESSWAMGEDGVLRKDEMTSTNPKFKENPPSNPFVVPHGEETIPAELKEGTCEYAAYWFAEYFTSGDSTETYKFCNDSMTQHVRALFQTPGQIKNMELNRAAGYKIEGVSIADESNDEECRACLRATMFDQEKVDCSFYFTKENGKWLLSSFAKTR